MRSIHFFPLVVATVTVTSGMAHARPAHRPPGPQAASPIIEFKRDVPLPASSGGASYVVSFGGGPSEPTYGTHVIPPITAPASPGSQTYNDAATLATIYASITDKCSGEGLAPADMKWTYSEEEALKRAGERNAAYAIFFCTDFTSRLAGEGPDAFAQFRKANAGVIPPLTVFDYTLVLNRFKAAGIELLVKVSETKETLALFKRYDATPGTLFICAPDGEKLAVFAGGNCNPSKVCEFLAGDYDKKMSSWEDAKKNKEEAAAWQQFQTARRKSSGVVSSIGDARLQNAFRFGLKIVAGGYPAGDAAFQALNELGVRTIIRVDGEPPETERADKLGIGCVHLPVAYSGITLERATAIAKAVRDLPGLIYIHGNPSDVRAPAAAAAAEVILGDMTGAQAAAGMTVAGTPTRYAALYSSIEAVATRVPEKLGAVEFNFTVKSEVSRLTAEMAAIQKTWMRIEAAQTFRWKISDARKEIKVDKDTVELIDRFLAAGSYEELSRLPKAADLLGETQTSLSLLIREWKNGHTAPAEIEKLDAAFKRASVSCLACHARYRDAPMLTK